MSKKEVVEDIKPLLKIYGQTVEYQTLDGLKTPAIVLKVWDLEHIDLRELHRNHVETNVKYGDGPGEWKFIP